jgi:predicted acetyltransferase
MPTLVQPSTQYQESFLCGAAEFKAEGRLDSTYAAFLGYDLSLLKRDFSGFVAALLKLFDPDRLPRGWFPDRVLWLIEADEYIGQASIRPELGTMYLITYGGHIGYSIRPSKRRVGYGRSILSLTLAQARAMGLKRVLITCDADNIASKKIIEANGGRFERRMDMDADIIRAEGRDPEVPLAKLRYWIPLADGAA